MEQPLIETLYIQNILSYFLGHINKDISAHLQPKSQDAVAEVQAANAIVDSHDRRSMLRDLPGDDLIH